MALKTTLSAYSKGQWVDPIELNQYGTESLTPKLCDTWDLTPGQNIDEILILFDQKNQVTPVQYISFVAGDEYLTIGNFQRSATSKVTTFRQTKENKIFGFWGYQDKTLQNLGVVTYTTKCDPNPGKLPSNMIPPPVDP